MTRSRRPGPLDRPLLTQSYSDVRDLSWLAPDEQSYECTGEPKILISLDGITEIIRPCGWIIPASGFRPRGAPYGAPKRARPVMNMCVVCEEKVRTARNRLDFWSNRITKAVRRHYHKEGPRTERLHAAPSFDDYLRLTGLDLAELTRRARESAERDGPCQHCQKPWSAFPGGAVMHLSLDRRDPTRLLTMDNYAYICRTGNSQYARIDPRTRTIRDAMYRIKADYGEL